MDREGEDAGDDDRAAEEGERCEACSVSCASSVNLVRSLAELRVIGILSIRTRQVIRKVSVLPPSDAPSTQKPVSSVPSS